MGRITDSTDAVIPGSAITVTNENTGIQYETVSNDSGYYTVPRLNPGIYRVAAQKEGFRPVSRSGIQLHVEQVARIDFVLEVGEVTETVEVTAEAPLLESETSTLGTLVDNRRVEELPLRGRNPYALATLVPGARVPVTWGELPVDMFSDQYAVINGARGNQNEFLLNGTPNTNGVSNGANIFPAVDSVQEFKVETNNYSAEYGRAAGAIFNVVTKSGTNEFHGSAYNFHRNENLNANDFFQNRAGQQKPPFVFNQYGFSLGGPIVPNRTFFFFSLEQARQREGVAFSGRMPTAAERAGDFSDIRTASGAPITIYDPLSTTGAGSQAMREPFANNQVPMARMDPVSLQLQNLLPMPNGPGAQFTRQDNLVDNASDSIDKDMWSIKIDHSFSDSHRVMGMYARDHSPRDRPNVYGNPATPTVGLQTFARHGAVFEDTWTINPTSIFSFRYGFSRMTNQRVPRGFEDLDITSLGWPQDLASKTRVPCVPRTTVTGFVTQLPSAALTGNPMRMMGHCDVIFFGLDTHSWRADLSKVTGEHTLKFGYEMRLQRNNSWQVVERDFNFTNAFTQGPTATRASPTAGFAYASFLMGHAASGINRISPAIAAQYFYHALYAQDAWRVTPKLTLNLGVRWELHNPRTDRFNQLTNFDYDAAVPLEAPGLNLRGALQFPGTGGLPRSQQEADLNNFSPRFGFAYQATAKTVVRGGFGISYAPLQSGTGAGGLSGYSANTSYVATLDGVTPIRQFSDPYPVVIQPTGSDLGAATLLGQSVSFVNRNERTPYTEQWNFNIQRELPSSFVADLAYVGSHGVKLPSGRTLNQLDPANLALGDGLRELVANPFFGQIETGPLSNQRVSRAQLLRPYPHFNGVTATQTNWGNSNYHALQATLEKRYSGGSLLVSYAYSKLIDDVGGPFAGEALAATGVQDWFDLRNERSVSPFNQTQSLVISYIWELPFGPGHSFGPQSGTLAKIFGGWQWQGVTSFQHGPPLGIFQSNNTTFAQGGGLRPNRTSADPSLGDGATVDRWFNTDVFVSPEPFAYGNSPRVIGSLRGHGTKNFDMAFGKKTGVTDRFTLEFRTEFFNIFNTPRFQVPVTNFSSGAFGRTSVQINRPRTIQFGLKLLF